MASDRLSYAARRAQILAQKHAYYLANREQCLASCIAWQAVHPEKVREIKRRSQGRRLIARREVNRRRKARLRGANIAPFTSAQLSQRMAMFGCSCWMCGGSFDEVDHVKPLAKGGPHILANLRPICRRCNQKKGDRWPLALR